MTEDIRWEQRFSNSETAQIIAEAIINEYFDLFKFLQEKLENQRSGRTGNLFS